MRLNHSESIHFRYFSQKSHLNCHNNTPSKRGPKMVAFNLSRNDMGIDVPILLELPNQLVASKSLNAIDKGRYFESK